MNIRVLIYHPFNP